MILIKTIRPDRVLLASSLFVAEKLKDKCMIPPISKIDDLYALSSKTTPILFILSPGTDPWN